jgi:hypothetical protein
MGGVVIRIYLLVVFFISSVFEPATATASLPFEFTSQQYRIEGGLPPTPLRVSKKESHAGNTAKEILPLRVNIKKFFVTKTADGFRVRFEPVCEKDANVEVDDLTSGGGFVQEKLFTYCESSARGYAVNVALSGRFMIT